MIYTTTKIKDGEYAINMDHQAICRLQSMLILCHNTAPLLTKEDKVFLRGLELNICAARQQGDPA